MSNSWLKGKWSAGNFKEKLNKDVQDAQDKDRTRMTMIHRIERMHCITPRKMLTRWGILAILLILGILVPFSLRTLREKRRWAATNH